MVTFSKPDISTSFMYRGICQELPKIGSLGDIWLCEGNEYAWVGGEWLPLGKTTDDSDVSFGGEMTAKICTRCGAPLKGHKCEYCGTEYGV